MKCPQCGHWNKPTFPRCFKCGEPLLQKEAEPAWQAKLSKPPAKKVHVVYDDSMPQEADLQPVEAAAGSDEPLATEMSRLKQRRERGVAYLSEFRKNASEKGIAPSGAGITLQRSTGFFQEVPDDPKETLCEPAGSRSHGTAEPPRPVARRIKPKSRRRDPAAYRLLDISSGESDPDIDIPPSYDQALPLAPNRRKRGRTRRSPQNNPVFLAIWAVRVLIAGALLFGLWQGYTFLNSQGDFTRSNEYASLDFTMTPTTVNGYPGQKVEIAGEEGAQYYISELRRSYAVVGGKATVEVPDFVFYDTIENIDVPQMDVSLTPTLQIGGREERMASINYTIPIPLSPISLIAPELPYLQVTTSIYNMQLQVLPGSRVIINGENISDSVNENGIVTFNPPVHAIGDNIIRISVSAIYHRENSMVVTLYRPPQDVPLELLADTILSTDKQENVIYAATSPGAAVIIESPHAYLNLSPQFDTNGNFSFAAIMSKVGYNLVRIRASLPGKEDSVLEHNIYYLPPPDTYTPKAWSLNASDYNELLGNIDLRVNESRIYLCRGEIVEVLSEKPQLAIMNTGADGREQLVLLQNESKTVWEPGKSYRVYADVCGIYDKMPRFYGRYTYNYD